MADEGARRVAKNASFLLLGVLLANAAAFFFRIILAREFGPGGFGVFSLALMITSIATMVALLGLPDGMITFVSKYRKQRNYDRIAGVVLASVAVSIGMAVTLASAVILIAPWLASDIFNAPELSDVLLWFAWVVPFNVLVDLSAAYFLGNEMGGYNTLIKQVIPKVTILLLVVGIAVVDGPLVAVGVAYLAALGIAAVIGVVAMGISMPWKRVDGVAFDVPNLLSFSIPLLFVSALGFLLNWTDTVLVGYFIDSEAIGIYQSAFILSANVHIVMGAISNALYPNFGGLIANRDFESIRNRYRTGVKWALVITMPPAVYLLMFPTVSLEWIYGTEFTAAYLPLVILVLSNLLILLMGPATNLLKATEESRFISISYGFGVFLNGVLNVSLIPIFGIIGAAIGTAISMTIVHLFHLYRCRFRLDVQIPLGVLWKTSAAAIVATLPSLFVLRFVDSVALFVGHIGAFSILYIAVLLLVGGVTPEEIRAISRSHLTVDSIRR